MVLSMVVIVIIMLISVGFTGLCSFNPGAPENGPVQRVDAANFVQQEQSNSTFPIVLPELGDEWIPNSARRSDFAGNAAPTVGWVTPNGAFAQLTQTAATTEEIIDSYDAPYEEVGASTVEGHEVRLFQAEGERDLRVVDLGSHRLVFTGSADVSEIDELIAATMKVSDR